MNQEAKWCKHFMPIEGVQRDVSGSPSSFPSDSVEPSFPASTAGPSSPTLALTLASMTGEHHPEPSVSLHTPAMTHSFSVEEIVDQIMDQMSRMFANFKSQILQSHDVLQEFTQSQFQQLHGDLLRITVRLESLERVEIHRIDALNLR